MHQATQKLSDRRPIRTISTHSDPIGGERSFKPKPLPKKDRQATKRLAKQLEHEFSRVEAGVSIDREVGQLNEARRQNTAIVRKILGRCYDLYLHYASSIASSERLYRACSDAGIKLTARMDLPTVVVRYHLRQLRPRLKRERCSQYVAAIRQAARDKIAPNTLAAHLAKEGQSIKAMAKRFAGRNREDKAPVPPPKMTFVCTEPLREKIDRFCARGECWLHVKKEPAGPLTIDQVRSRRD